MASVFALRNTLASCARVPMKGIAVSLKKPIMGTAQDIRVMKARPKASLSMNLDGLLESMESLSLQEPKAKELSQALVSKTEVAKAQLSQWLHQERYVNGIAPRKNNPHATYTEVEEQFRPGGENPSFKLPMFSLSREMCNVHLSKVADPTIVANYSDANVVQFAVHPQVFAKGVEPHLEKLANKPQKFINVAPTASSRSLFVIDESTARPHIVKTHLPLRITRNMRGLNDPKIEHSLAISDRIGAALASFKNPKFAYLPETFGVSIKGKKSSDSWGYLVRELTPRPFLPDAQPRALLPLFALYSTDKASPDKPPILCDLIEASGEDPKKFVLERILHPIIRVWADTYQKTGIILESHGQNTLFELNEKGLPDRVVSRDFSAYVSREMYKRTGGTLSTLNASKTFSKLGQGIEPPTACILSSVFDQSVKVPFERIAQVCQERYKIAPSELQKSCQEYFREVFPTADLHFPAQGITYNIKDVDFTNVPTSGGRTEFVELQQAALWR